jgi:hypothetical protein
VLFLLIYSCAFLNVRVSLYSFLFLSLTHTTTNSAPRYTIPRGGLFEYVTCPQYFCEIVTFIGMALLSCGPNGCFIVAVSLVNLVPRAVSTTAWYHDKFGDAYPEERRHLVPFLF